MPTVTQPGRTYAAGVEPRFLQAHSADKKQPHKKQQGWDCGVFVLGLFLR